MSANRFVRLSSASEHRCLSPSFTREKHRKMYKQGITIKKGTDNTGCVRNMRITLGWTQLQAQTRQDGFKVIMQ